MTETKILALEEIDAIARRALSESGANEEAVRVLSDTIVAAERDGSSTHGLSMLPSYFFSIRDGWANGSAEPIIKYSAAAAIHVDGANGYGQIALNRVRDQAIKIANQNGTVVLAIKNIHHIGPLGPDIEPFAEHGLCALEFVNTTALLVPWGGKRPVFGTNPMAFACPRPDGSTIVWDQASSVLSISGIGKVNKEGLELDEVAGLDTDAMLSRDPSAILQSKRLLPFAKHKGTAIALMVEVLAAALTGSSLAVQNRPSNEPRHVSKDCGQFFILINPDLVGGEGFALRLAPMLEAFTDNGLARIPGDGRLLRRKNSISSGVNVDLELLNRIEGLFSSK